MRTKAALSIFNDPDAERIHKRTNVDLCGRSLLIKGDGCYHPRAIEHTTSLGARNSGFRAAEGCKLDFEHNVERRELWVIGRRMSKCQ